MGIGFPMPVVYRAGIHVRSAGPVADGVDLRPRKGVLQIFGGGAALADDEPVAVENVFSIAGVTLENAPGDTGQSQLLLRQRDAFEDAVVAAAETIGLIF